jgi:hypothetical protein
MAKKKEVFRAKYDVSDILDMYTSRTEDKDEARLRNFATEFRALCRLEHEVKIPSQYKSIARQIRTPFIRDAWQRIASALVAKQPVAHIEPKDDARQDYREAANLGERFDMAAMERWNRDLGTDIIYEATAALVRDGESVLKVVHKPSAWANFPEGKSKEEQDEWKRGVELPIAMRVVDRLSCVFDDGEYGDSWAIEYGEYGTPYLKGRYGLVGIDDKLVNPRNVLEGKPMPEGLQASVRGRTVKVEFWDPEEWHVIIDGAEAPGFPKPNIYAPHLPLIRAKAHESESLLYSLIFLVPRLDEALTMKLVWSIVGAYPNPILKTIPNANGLPALEGPLGNSDEGSDDGHPIIWEPGKFIELPLGKELGFLSPPPIGPDLNDLASMLKGLIDIAGIPAVMRGTSGSMDSGYLAAQMRAAAEMMYRMAAVAGERQLAKAFELVHWMVQHIIRQPIYVRGWDEVNEKTGKPSKESSRMWLGLSPSDEFKGKYLANVQKMGSITFAYRPTMATDEQAKAMVALQLTNSAKPLYSRRDALERILQEEDPDSIIEEIYVEEQIDKDPYLNQLVIDAALAKAGLKPPTPAEPAAPEGVDIGMATQIAQGGPMLPSGPSSLQPTPLGNQAPPGMAGVPGMSMPIVPPSQGVPGAPGGRVAGSFPGAPSGPNMQ